MTGDHGKFDLKRVVGQDVHIRKIPSCSGESGLKENSTKRSNCIQVRDL